MSQPLNVTAIATGDLSPTTRAAIIELCIEAHGLADFKNLFTYVPSGGRHYLAYAQNALVAHAMVTTRWLQSEGLPQLKTAYVDAVSTAPAVQGRGYGSAVMRYLAQDVGASHAIACLETDIPEFYTPLGWELWRGALAGRSECGLIPTPDQTGVMVLRLSQTPSLNLDAPLSIECQPARIW
jgi:GNAT superfamily N-acetyltransferase